MAGLPTLLLEDNQNLAFDISFGQNNVPTGDIMQEVANTANYNFAWAKWHFSTGYRSSAGR